MRSRTGRLEEAFTQHIARELVPEYRSPWWTKHSKETVSRYWEQIANTELKKPSEEAGPIFINTQDGGYPLGLGYALSYQLGQELLTEYELQEYPSLSKKKIVKVGNRLYKS